MPRPLRPVTLLVVIALLVLASSSAWAQDRRGGRPGGNGEHDAMPSTGMQGPQDRDRAPMAMPPRARPGRRDDALSDSIRSVERSTRGQVLSAERIQSDGRDLNRIKVIDGRGRVRVYMDDPQQRRRPSPTRGDDN